MKKWFALAIVAVITILVVASVAYAQAPQPQSTPQSSGPGYGRGGMMGGQPGVGRGGMMSGLDGNEGALHDGMLAYFAEKLGLTAADIETRLDAGETMRQIAESKGLTADAFQTLMVDARSSAIDAAVKAGTLTQAQADWMKQRGLNMPMFQNGFDPDDCPMNGGTAAGRGMMGGSQGGRGRWSQPAPAAN